MYLNSTGAIRVAGVANTNVSSYSVFWVWYVKKSLRKSDTNIFGLSVLMLGLYLKKYHQWKWELSFSLYQVKVCFLLHSLLHRLPYFLVFMHLQSFGKKWRNCLHGPPQGSANGLVNHWWSCAFCYRLPWFTNSSGCYLNATVSTPVFKSYSITMCN